MVHQIGGRNPQRLDPIARERRAIEDIRAHLREQGVDVEIWFWDKNAPGASPLVDPDLGSNWVPGSIGT